MTSQYLISLKYEPLQEQQVEQLAAPDSPRSIVIWYTAVSNSVDRVAPPGLAGELNNGYPDWKFFFLFQSVIDATRAT